MPAKVYLLVGRLYGHAMTKPCMRQPKTGLALAFYVCYVPPTLIFVQCKDILDRLFLAAKGQKPIN